SKALLRERMVYFNELKGFANTKVYRGPDVEAGNVIAGPAIIEYPGTTVVVGPQQVGNIDRFLNVLIETK
ncbi:MAG: hydantoinase/oxoprolinase family protein, partial [Dehalococcoidia bacterium]|nr:hydantoinase/oxoprolinase family protein [Dehalococcoidia bacterium]